MTIYLWITGGLTGAGIVMLVGIFFYLSFIDSARGHDAMAWALIGWYFMMSTAFFAAAHAVGWLMHWLM